MGRTGSGAGREHGAGGHDHPGRFFDDFLRRVTGTGEARQVVLLAAGLDTRGYRLGWPDHFQVFELDQPEVLDRKQEHPGRRRGETPLRAPGRRRGSDRPVDHRLAGRRV